MSRKIDYKLLAMKQKVRRDLNKQNAVINAIRSNNINKAEIISGKDLVPKESLWMRTQRAEMTRRDITRNIKSDERTDRIINQLKTGDTNQKVANIIRLMLNDRYRGNKDELYKTLLELLDIKEPMPYDYSRQYDDDFEGEEERAEEERGEEERFEEERGEEERRGEEEFDYDLEDPGEYKPSDLYVVDTPKPEPLMLPEQLVVPKSYEKEILEQIENTKRRAKPSKPKKEPKLSKLGEKSKGEVFDSLVQNYANVVPPQMRLKYGSTFDLFIDNNDNNKLKNLSTDLTSEIKKINGQRMQNKSQILENLQKQLINFRDNLENFLKSRVEGAAGEEKEETFPSELPKSAEIDGIHFLNGNFWNKNYIDDNDRLLQLKTHLFDAQEDYLKYEKKLNRTRYGIHIANRAEHVTNLLNYEKYIKYVEARYNKVKKSQKGGSIMTNIFDLFERFKILVGEIESGNTNKILKNELADILHYFYKNKKIDKKDYRMFMNLTY